MSHVRLLATAALTLTSLNTAYASDTVAKPAVTEKASIIQFDKDARATCEGLPGCEFILLNGDPKTGPTQWFFQLKAGQPFPRHWHSTPENMVAIRGVLHFDFETGQSHSLKPGEYLHYQAGMAHGGQCEPGADCLFYVFNDKPYDFHLAD